MAENQSKNREKSSTTYTTFLDLVRTVNQLTDDDGLVVATVRHLLESCRAKTARSLVPVRVVGSHFDSRIEVNHRHGVRSY